MVDFLVTSRVGSVLALASLAACSGTSNAPAQSEGARRGETVFVQNCSQCHIVREGKGQSAPSLRNILGRKAGSTNFPYSAAFRRVDFVWDRENLDRFLADPRRVVPNNGMAFFGMPDVAARSDLIEYLAMMSPSASKQ